MMDSVVRQAIVPKCDFCEHPATRIAFYGGESTVVGGGQGTHYCCDHCVPPCNLVSDPHASYTHEESASWAGDRAAACLLKTDQRACNNSINVLAKVF